MVNTEKENQHDPNHSKTNGTSGRNVPQTKLPIAFGLLSEQQKCSKHGWVRTLDAPVRQEQRKELCMIRKFFTVVNDFLIAWSEHRHQQLKNRNYHSYYWYEFYRISVDVVAMETTRMGSPSFNHWRIYWLVLTASLALWHDGTIDKMAACLW